MNLWASQVQEYKGDVVNKRLRHIAVVALGGNVASHVGDPAATLAAAIIALKSDSVQIVAVSQFYQTPCFPAGVGPDYINAAAILSTDLEPGIFLNLLHRTEAEFGRQRRQRWGNRTLDLDLLAYDDLISPDPATYKDWRDLAPEEQVLRAPAELILPHPRLHERAFVLVPLQDIARHWRHPVLGMDVDQMVAGLPPADVAAVIPVPAGNNRTLSSQRPALK